MITKKNVSLLEIVKLSGHHIAWLLLGASAIAYLYRAGIIAFTIPWLPVSVIGTAVAFYVGFKNNQSYDRMWEARKVWGGIVNDSRAWGMMVDGYVDGPRGSDDARAAETHATKQRLVYRHIAWLYTHREQLLAPMEWEHASQGGLTAKFIRSNERRRGIGLVADEWHPDEVAQLLDPSEYARLTAQANTATQLINEQSRDLQVLRDEGRLNDFRHVEMVNVLRTFYTYQGQNERIKKFPLPRQYANISSYFVTIFLLLLPFSMIPALLNEGELGLWLCVPITALVGWVYVMMEVIGDYSENPFQRLAYDIPMLSLCRAIEIDLREMLGETDLPPGITSKNGVLM